MLALLERRKEEVLALLERKKELTPAHLWSHLRRSRTLPAAASWLTRIFTSACVYAQAGTPQPQLAQAEGAGAA